MKVFVKGIHGCGMRKADVRQYADFLTANHHEVVADPGQGDVILLWTCAFRGDYRDNSISEIKRYMNTYDGELIVVGCLPDIDRELLQKEFPGRFINWKNDDGRMEEYFGTSGKQLADIPRQLGDEPLCDDVDAFKKANPDVDATFVDQFIKLYVAEGCQFKCSYCTEILAFPPFKSFPESDLISECRRLVNKTGRKEVMLLGDSLGDYGCDIGTTLPSLIRNLVSSVHPDLKIALQGYNPANFNRYFDEMSEFIEKGYIRHMQLPIQSASSKILTLMNRPYCREHIDRIFSLLNRLKFTEIDTHIIIGFPGEAEEDYEETIQFILRHRPKYVLASNYMEAPSAPSYQLPDKVSEDTKRRRIQDATKRIQAAGILCNSDGSQLSADRFSKLNSVS